MTSLTVAIIGCGQIAQSHLHALADIDDGFVVHLCDLDGALARRTADSSPLPIAGVHDDAARLLNDVGVDVVHLTTPPGSHFELARRSIESNAHVIVEKPMARTTAQVEELYDLADEHNVMIAADHSVLLMPCVVRLLDVCRSGDFGEPVSVDCYFGHAEAGGTMPYGSPGHWAYREDGGVLLNLITHPASLLAAVLGAPDEIHRLLLRRNLLPNDVPDLVHVSASFGSALGSFTVSMAHGNADRVATVRLEGATVNADLSRQITTVLPHEGPSNAIDKVVGGYRSGLSQIGGMTSMLSRVARGRLQRDPGLREFVHQFYGAVLHGGALPVSRANVLASARLTDVGLEARS